MNKFNGLSIALWVLQTLLALLFALSGIVKFVMPMEQITRNTPLPPLFIYFIGAMEVIGSLGLILPALLRLLPVLTPLASSGLTIIMAGATVISMPKGKMAIFPFGIGLLTLFVAYGRFRLRPVPARA
jgi:uncharacterized membrane protein YphA (DoxX/SURF4 family)